MRRVIHERTRSRAAAGAGVTLAVVVTLSALVGVPSVANAALGQCGAFGARFDGFYSPGLHDQIGVEGVSANIRVEDGAVCGSDASVNNLTATWVMIYPTVGGGLAQVGFWRTGTWSGFTPQYFYEYGATDSGVGQGWHTGVADGTTHRFWVQWVTNGCPGGLPACFAFNIDNVRIHTSDFNPYQYWGNPDNANTMWIMALMGEAHYAESDIMGSNTGGVATVWDSAQAQDWATNNYRGFPCDLLARDDNAARWGLNYPTNKGCGAWSTYTIAGTG